MALLAVPAAVFRFTCVGSACNATAAAAPQTAPFCSLPPRVRDLVAEGFRDGRSPEVLGVVRDGRAIDGGTGSWSQTVGVAWPGLASDPRVPIVFSGAGVASGAVVEAGTTLSQIAPTLSSVIGFDRPFPDVRSGTEIPGLADRSAPRLVIEVALKGVGTEQVSQGGWDNLRRLMAGGTGTLEGSTGSIPLDPSASLTTIGTGGTPAEHGITGSVLRNDEGSLALAWGPGAPVSIIATLPEDLDEATRQRSLVGLVATDRADAGIVGGAWYPRHDRDATKIVASPADAVLAARRMLETGFGADATPDVLAVVIQGSAPDLDAALGRLRSAATRASGGSAVIAVAGTGSTSDPGAATAITADDLVREVEGMDDDVAGLVDVAVPGGLFLDRDGLARSGLTGQVVRDALLSSTGSDGEPLMADAFQAFAVPFGRYC